VGVDKPSKQEKLEATLCEMLENAAREASHTSGARFVGRFFLAQDSPPKDTII